MKRKKVAVIGAGRVGTALAVLLHRHGYPVVGVASRTLASAESCARLCGCKLATTDPSKAARPGNIILITTPDGVVRDVCGRIAREGGFEEGDLVIHTSGFLDSRELQAAEQRGALVLSMHPVQTFADLEAALENLPGSYFGLEGEDDAVELGKELVGKINGKGIAVPRGAKPLYHAAACAASNYLVALIGLSLELYERAGIPRADGLKTLLPLIRGTLANIEAAGVPAALTGPIDRGDAEVLRQQLISIEERAPQLLSIFAELARYTVAIATEKESLSEEKAAELLRRLNGR